MSDKYVIAWPGTPPYSSTQIYFKELLFKTSRYDSYGSTPVPTITRTRLLTEARIFDTIREADQFFHKINEYTKINRFEDISYVSPISGKELFAARLKDE